MYKQLAHIIIKSVFRVWRQRLIIKYKRFLIYSIGGGIGFIIYFSILYSLTEWAHFWYLFSATIAFIISAVANYFFQRHITFADNKSAKVWRQFIIFILVAIVGLLINNLILYTSVEFLKIWYMFGGFIAAGIVLVWNFTANKNITFRQI